MNTQQAGEARCDVVHSRVARRITVAGTSFLLPGNAAWDRLKADCEVIFADVSEWSGLLFRHEPQPEQGDTLLLTVFLQDVISPDRVAALEAKPHTSTEQLDEQLEPLWLGIDHALASRPRGSLLVAWCNVHQPVAIRCARRLPVWDLIAARWEEQLRQRQARFPSLLQLPLNRFFASEGLDLCLDPRNYYAARCRLSRRGLEVLTGRVKEIVDRLAVPAKKVLALDCDNTLWGGTIGEDGLAGIQLGQDGVGAVYCDFQRAARRLAQSGVLLALVSKNNESDVWNVFAQHPSMVLGSSDITAARISWQDKSDALLAIAEELGLAMDSFVFWDDNPLERESVRRRLPDVAVPEIPSEVWQWPGWLEASPLFASFEATEEDGRRAAMYHSRGAFQSAGRLFDSEIDFLKSIALRPSVVFISEGTISRASQLTAKTNQFNLRTRRHDPAAIRRINADPASTAFLVHLEDKFGDHGNVGLVIAHFRHDPRVAFLDTFLLSCRILGRHIEAWMLQECVTQLQQKGAQILLAEFIPTERNAVASAFLPEHGLVDLAQCSLELRQAVEPYIRECTGQVFAARLAEIAIPHLDIYIQ